MGCTSVQQHGFQVVIYRICICIRLHIGDFKQEAFTMFSAWFITKIVNRWKYVYPPHDGSSIRLNRVEEHPTMLYIRGV